MDGPGREDFGGTTRFAVRRRLGEGAFGVVYEVLDRDRDTLVALKTLRRANVESLYRLKQEFRALAGIVHPNLVALYELLSDGDQCFFTMELVKGRNFLEYVRGPTAGSSADADAPTVPAGTLRAAEEEDTWISPPDSETERPALPSPTPLLTLFQLSRLRAALAQTAEGVWALHQAGKLHRDIKPSNVIVTQDGRVVLLDFGLVTELYARETDQSLELAGTPAYMSPEVGAKRAVSEASDWYSVGVMLYEALTGRRPFYGTPADVLRSKQSVDPPAPCELVPETPKDLDRLCRDLLLREAEARPSGRKILQRVGVVSQEPPRARTTSAGMGAYPPLVGRERHLEKLRDAFQAVRNGRAVSVYVYGRSGLGKSALARYFLEELRQTEDVVSLSGRCYEQESVPYKALDSLVDALSQYLKGLPLAQAETLLPEDILALSRLFPVLRRVEAVARARRRVLEIPDSQELRRRAFTAMHELLSRLAARKKLVLFLDDLQWGDVDSALLLSELLRPPDPPPLLLIACYRREDAATSPFLRKLLPLKGESGSAEAREILLEELTFSEARELARAFLHGDGSETEAEAIARESGGNPFFVGEFVRYSRAPGLRPAGALPEKPWSGEVTLEEVIGSRVSRLPEEGRRLLEVLAVAGRPLELPVAKRAALLSGEERALALLRSEHLLRTRATEEGDEIEPYHDRIREVVVANLPREALRNHHSRLALALESSRRADPETLALHFRESGDSERAADYAILAAERAAEALAFDRAAKLYRLGLELRASKGSAARALRVKLGEALANAGRGAEAAYTYLKAAEGAKPSEILELDRRSAEQLLISGHIDEGVAVLRTVLGSMGMRLAETPRAALLSLLWRRARIRLRGLSFEERDSDAIAHERLTQIDACWSVAVGLGLVDPIRGNDFQGKHLLLSLEAGEPYRLARALAIEAGFSAASGGRRRARTDKLLRRAAQLADRIQNPHAVGLATLTAGIASYLEGRWKEALEQTEKAEEILREECTGVAWERDNAHHYGLRSLFYLGEWRQLFHRLPVLLKEAEERGDLYAATNLRTRYLYLSRLARAQREKARDEIEHAMANWSLKGFHVQHYYELFGLAEIALCSGRGRAAWDGLESKWKDLRRSLLQRVQFVFLESHHLRARCALAAAMGGGEEAEPFLRSAEQDCGRLERERMEWADPLARLLRAGVAACRGKREDAVALLDRAEGEFAGADMSLYGAAARYRRGELLGGQEGKTLIASAEASMKDQGIEDPTGIADMLAPGRWRT